MAKNRKTSGDAPAAGTKAKAKPEGPPRQPGVERRKNHPTRAKDGYIQLVLTHAVPHLGRPGDLVKVRPGYARNYLLPKGLGTFATPHALRIVGQHKKRLEIAESARLAELKSLAGQIAQRKYLIPANSDDKGHLYGSVNAEQIAAALRADNFPINAENVKIEYPLKELGQFTIGIHLAPEVDTEIELWVVPAQAAT